MDPLSVTASILAILQVTAALVNYANDVKDAPKDRARFAMEASSLSSLLLNLRYQIEDEQSNKAWFKEVALLAVPDGPLDQYKHALEKLQLKIVSGKGLAKIGGALLWKFSKEEVASILLRIERLKSLIQIALQMDHFKLSQAIKTSLDEIYDNSEELKLDMGVVRSQIPAIQDGVDAVQQDQQRQNNQKLVEWISSANYSSQLSDVIAKRETGTGQWFLDSPEFNTWLAGGPSHTLFCPGIPGAGKTMISAIASDHLHKMAYTDRSGVAQIFCNYKTQSEQNTTSLLSAILKQLVQAKPSAAKAANILYQQHSDRGTRPSLDDIFAALKTTMMSFSTLYVVVDALDECTDQDHIRRELLEKLRELQQAADVRLMVTSRANPDIVNQFKTSPTLEIQASPADVRRYVRGQIEQLNRCVQSDEKLQKEIEDKIGEAVDGMFLLARLHVDSLRGKRTKARVQSILKVLPTGAEALRMAYDDAIKRIESQRADDSKLAKSVLSWITYAERPLSTSELCHALAVEPDATDLDEGNILHVDDIVSVCAGLVTVDEGTSIVRLVHYTTQEYFLQIRHEWNPTAQQEITTACFTYLSFDPFKCGSCDSIEDLKERKTCYTFLEYASRYWGDHVQTVQEQASKSAFDFLQDPKLISCALQAQVSNYILYNYDEYQRFERLVTGVHLTAGRGYQYLLAGLLSGSSVASGVLADSKDGSGRTPLSWAAERGHVATAKLLVERDDVDVNSKDKFGRTPLSRAAERGHVATAKLLVERGDVDVNSKDKFGRTPLLWAAWAGNKATVKLLLELVDVEADTKDEHGNTPLLRAADNGYEEIVKFLLERKDVEADAKDEYGNTPLLWAAQRGYEAVVELLVGREDVDINWKNHEGQTPLSLAAQNGHETIVELLLEREDVKADAKDHKGRTPLSWAAELEEDGVMKLLVDREDARVDSRDNLGKTPFSWAAWMGNESVVKLLIEREDVEVDSKDNYGHTPLMGAIATGKTGVVRLLLEREDVDPAVEGKKGWTPLSFAARFERPEIVKLLLEKNINADVKNHEGKMR